MVDEPYIQSVSRLTDAIRKDRRELLNLISVLNDRVARYDFKLKSFVRVNPQLLQDSEKTDPRSLLTGLPIAVKDLIDTHEIATTYGSRTFEQHFPSKDAEVVENIKRNGGIIQGKTNTHEFALGISTPPTVNPWDLTRIPGGSSGGSASAISAGLSIVALGTDTGGSIRIPSAMCGITGLKPTYGRFSMDGIFPESFAEDHVGPMCRYASDLRIILNSMSSQDQGVNCKRVPPLKIGLINEFFSQSDIEVARLALKALEKMESEGAVCELRDFALPNLDIIKESHDIIDKTEIFHVHTQLYPESRTHSKSDVIEEMEAGRKLKAADYVSALRFKVRAKKEFSEALRGIDVIASPTLPRVAPTILESERFTLSDHGIYTKFLTPFNYLGTPSITVPCGFSAGLPVGLQLVADTWKDDTVVALASSYQEVTAWHTKICDMFV